MNQFINFFPNQPPSLLSGKYTVHVSQETNIGECEIEDAAFEFTVWSEQISMNPALVYSTYPPQSSAADYSDCLPHIVLSRKSLPWERQLFHGDAETPRLCLLVFSKDEGVTASSGTYKSAIAEESGIFAPVLQENRIGPDDEPCLYIDIPYTLFSEVLPYKDELKYLAHVKVAALDDKVTDKDVNNGLFSCIVSNRYPKKAETPVRHAAHLVSLEGFESYLEHRKPENVGNKNKVRMFSLANWEFICAPDGLSFYQEAIQINTGAFMPDSANVKNQTVKKLMGLGYGAINHNMRDGSKTVSWYRPPLVPMAPADESKKICHYSDSLLRYDPELGMFDISYQAAWQLGRSLAFCDKNFSKELISWRLRTKSELAQIQTEDAVISRLDGASGNTETMLADNWKKLAAELIEECGQDDVTNLKDTGLPDFSKAAAKIVSSNSEGFTQRELINLYD